MSQSNVESLKKIRDSAYKRIKLKEQGGFVDCCKEYKFIRDFDTYNFNKKMNLLRITDLVLNDGDPKKKGDNGYNLGEMIENTIINPIKYNSNIVVGIIGETGSGKSELAQVLSLISRDANKKYKNRDVEIHICWTPEDLFNALIKVKKGDVIMKDESPKAFGEGARIEKWSIDNALAVIRKEQNTFIFCDPMDIKISLCDLYLETAGMNFKTRTNRFMVLNKERFYFGHIYTTLHKDKEFRDRYEKEKDNFVKETKRLAGKFLSGLRKDKTKTIDADFTEDKKKKQKKLTIGNFPLRSIEYLRKHLKETKNEITVKEYAILMEVSIDIARSYLNKFVKKKEFDYIMRKKAKVYYSKR